MLNLALFERMLAAHRNRGIRTTLLNAAIAHARDRRCARIVLSPSELSVPFYQRAGFGPATMLLAHVLDS